MSVASTAGHDAVIVVAVDEAHSSPEALEAKAVITAALSIAPFLKKFRFEKNSRKRSGTTVLAPMSAKEVKASSMLVWSFKRGQMVSFLIHIGDRLK